MLLLWAVIATYPRTVPKRSKCSSLQRHILKKVYNTLAMIISSGTSTEKLSWFRTDLSSLSSLDGLPYFSLVKILNSLLINGYFLFLIGIKFYVSYYKPIFSEQYKTIQEILTFNPQNAILTGTTISLVVSLLIIGSLIKTYFSKKLAYVTMPEAIRKNREVSLLYVALKAPEIVPKGFDVILSTAWGVFGIGFFLFLLIINQENNTLLDWMSFLITYNMIFYCLMASVFIAFNPYSLFNSFALFAVVLLLPYLTNKKLVPENYESLLIFWLPIITLYILPLLAKRFRIRNNLEGAR